MKKYYFLFFTFYLLPFTFYLASAQECNIIYCSPTGTTSGVAGTRANPAEINYGLSLVSSSAKRLWLATGTYNISNTLVLVDSVTIEGGFNSATWEKSNSAESIIVKDNLGGDLLGIGGINVTGFRLQDLTISVADAVAGNGNSVYGIYLDGCSNYNITRCKVIAGTGGQGAAGTTGATGIAGGNGANGLPACNESCVPAGGAGGTGVGGNNGGNGGAGAKHNPNGTEIGSAGLSSGCGGAGGNGGDGPSCGCGLFGTSFNNSCSGSSPSSGQNGGNGTSGTSGTVGTAGSVVGGFWVPGGSGGNGTSGTSGCGGGGGGGGAGRQQNGQDDVGGSGGGGGGGGEGGGSGTGGSGGGSSYAIFLFNNGTGGIIQDCQLTAGTAGAGGIGGAGGAGSTGGIGGTGGSGFGCGMSVGANGGNGGDGGQGGSGGSGASGESVNLKEVTGTAVTQSGTTSVPGNPPVITVVNKGCTNAEVIFSSTTSGNWNFGTGANPATANGTGPISVTYSSLGRKTITFSGTNFTEYVDIFNNSFSTGNIIPLNSTQTLGCPDTFSTSLSGTYYQWLFPSSANPDTVEGAAMQTASNIYWGAIGTYTVKVWVTTACCGRVLDSTTVTVNSSSFNVSMTATPSTVCAGDTITFSSSPTTYAGYSFLVNNNPIQTGINSTFSTSTLQAGDSVVVVGLVGTCFTNPSAVIYPTINPIPSVTLTSSDGDNTICAGESVTFTASPSGYDNYEFFDGGTSVQNGASNIFTTTTLASGNSITVVATDLSCPSPASNTIVTTVNPLPNITLTSSDVDNTICAGDTVTFTASPSGVANYNFSINGSSVQNGAGNFYTTSSLVNGNTINIVATSNVSCIGPVSNTLTFTVNPIPTVNLTASDDSVCPGDNIIFSASPSGNSNYEFFNNATSAQDSSAATFSTTTLTSGNNITVIATNLGCSSPGSNVISIYVYPTPSVNISSSDADSTICAGDTVTFTASPSGYNLYNFSVNGTLVQNTSVNIFTTFSLINGDIISVNAVDFGCPSLASSSSFTVNSFATANAGASSTICSGNSYTLNGVIGGSATGNTWSSGGSGTFDNSALASAIYSPSTGDISSGNIILTFTSNDPDGSGPCPAVSDTMVLSINLAATANAGADQTICADTTQILNGSTGGSATSSTWTTNGSGTFDNSSLASATYSPSAGDIAAGNVVLILTTNDPDGAGPCSTVSDAMILTINPVPVVTVSASSNTICEDDTVTFTVAPSTNDNYQFFINGVSVLNGTDSVFSSGTITISDTITVIATDLGCVSSLSNAVSITVNPTPTVVLSTLTNVICAGDSVVFTADSSGYDNYQFFNGANSLQNGMNNIFITTALISGNNITVIATDLNCPSPASNAISITVNSLPVVNIVSAKPFICNGDSTTLTATVISGANYNWNPVNTINPITVNPTTNTNYSVTVTDANGCVAAASFPLSVLQVINVSAGNDVFVCNGIGEQLNATAGFSSYQWTPATGLSNPNISNPVAYPVSATTYTVLFTDANGCKKTDSILVTPSSAVADAGPDVKINYGQENPLAASGGTQFQWSPAKGLSCTNCQTPMAGPLENTTYTITVTNADGCTDVDDVNVEVIITTEVFVPDAFSPNGDGENDKLFVRGPTIAELSFYLYDRWGNKVFEIKNKSDGWDGKINGNNADAAVYVYVLYAKIVNGFEVRKKGDVVLVR